MSVAKVLTGRDAPLGNIEMTLHNTYRLVKGKLEKQYGQQQS